MPGEPTTRNGVALVVGVGKYPHPAIRPLEFAADDAAAMAECLTDPQVCGFPATAVELLLDEHASRDTLVQRLSRWLPERAHGSEIVLIYFAGHGLVQKVGALDEGFLLPADVDPENPAGRGLAMSDVTRWIGALEAGAVVVCLDCCHAGGILPRGPQPPPASRDFVLRPDVLQGLAGSGRFLLASCNKGEYSVELHEFKHGLFTYHLLSGLHGDGDRDGDGKVGVAELFEHVAESVARDARQRGVEQHPWQACVGAGGVYLSQPRRRSGCSVMQSFERLRREEGDQAVVREVERRLAVSPEADVPELLRRLGRLAHVAAVPVLFRHLPHGNAEVREQARRALQAIGWDRSLAAVEELARNADAPVAEVIMAGLAVFEARPDLVRLLDHLVDIFQGELRLRAHQLLEHKRLGLGLERTIDVFRQSRSPYKPHKVLGQGLFTAAYLARDETMDLEVVVRVLRPEFVGQPEVRRQFLELCRKAIRFNHQRLVNTLEVRAFPELDFYYIVRRYIPGLTLQQVLAAGRRFRVAEALEVMRQVLEALSALHPEGVVHGAVDPSNVFVCSGDRVVLGDLSLPPQGVGEAIQKRLAYVYRYAAPESLVGGPAGPTADFYSLGCLAYELVCGEPPFVSENCNEVLVSQATRPVPRPRLRCPEMPQAFEGLLLRLLAKDPSRRPATVAEALRLVEDTAVGLSKPDRPALPPATPTADTLAADDVRSEPRLLRDSSLAQYEPPQSMFSMGPSRSAKETVRPAPGPSLPPGPPVSSERLPVDRIPGYQIVEIIGRGGMGVVYKARQLTLNRLVALKMVLHAEYAGPEAQRRFLVEAEAAARLQHSNIVQIYDVGQADGVCYLSLEYCAGGTLDQKMNGTPWSPRDAAELVATLARAIHAAHESGIVHRDLKPANVLFTADGQPKIGDFGLAKMMDQTGQTHSGAVMGTPAYMAPEQAGGRSHEVGPAADVYTLGALCYELLTGRPPFGAGTTFEIMRQVMSQEPVALRRLIPNVPRDLETICLKCLQKEPARRYESALALAHDLQQFLDSEPISARPISLPARSVKWLRRRPTVRALLWLAGLVGVGAVLWGALHH